MTTKKCSICKKDLPATDEFFACRKDRKHPTFQSSCKKCHKQYRKDHYKINKSKYIIKAKAYRGKVVDWFIELKGKLICSICGESRYWVLDFHHFDSSKKNENIGDLVRKCSMKKVIEELKKCTVLCSNCHRDLHHKERLAV